MESIVTPRTGQRVVRSGRGLQLRRHRGRRGDNQPLTFDPVDHFAAEMDDFAQCVLHNKRSKVPGEEGLRDLKIVTAIYESIRKGREVKLS
jgi:predicted dehydrogenase